MEIYYQDTLRKPRVLIVELRSENDIQRADIGLSESGGLSYRLDNVMTREQWLEWVQKFRDDLTGRELREILEHESAPFVWPQCWNEFRDRYAATGNAFLD